MDVSLNKYIFDFFVLKDNVRRNAYLNLLWNVSSSLSRRLSDLITTVGGLEDLLLCCSSKVDPSVPYSSVLHLVVTLSLVVCY